MVGEVRGDLKGDDFWMRDAAKPRVAHVEILGKRSRLGPEFFWPKVAIETLLVVSMGHPVVFLMERIDCMLICAQFCGDFAVTFQGAVLFVVGAWASGETVILRVGGGVMNPTLGCKDTCAFSHLVYPTS